MVKYVYEFAADTEHEAFKKAIDKHKERISEEQDYVPYDVYATLLSKTYYSEKSGMYVGYTYKFECWH